MNATVKRTSWFMHVFLSRMEFFSLGNIKIEETETQVR